MTILILNQNYLVQRELIAAFKALEGIRVIECTTDGCPEPEQAAKICAVLKAQDCRILVTLNDWGLDKEGAVADFLRKQSIIHVNWYVDDPFFTEITLGITHAPQPNRIDFVTDRGYVQPLRDRGFSARFLPLATDPAIFFSRDSNPVVRDVCFVGNSYLCQTYESIKGYESFFELLVPDIRKVIDKYQGDPLYDMEKDVQHALDRHTLPSGLTRKKAVYLVKHFAGYLHRKNLVLGLASWYPGFTVFGDEYWSIDLPAAKLVTTVKYYTNLSETYQQTKITIDINRLVIRDGFTQRIFDCLAAGGFVVTSNKKVVEDFFITSGPLQEIVVFKDHKDLRRVIDYFLVHDQERAAIAARGRMKVLAEHTYSRRVEQILSTVRIEMQEV